jgi:hypothetical protein
MKPGDNGFCSGFDKMQDYLKDRRSLNSAPRVKCGKISACFPTVFSSGVFITMPRKVAQGKGEKNVLN